MFAAFEAAEAKFGVSFSPKARTARAVADASKRIPIWYRIHPPNPLASACTRNAVAELHPTAGPSLQVKPILQVSDIAPGQLRCSSAASPPSRARRSMHALGQGLGAGLLRDACVLCVFPYVP